MRLDKMKTHYLRVKKCKLIMLSFAFVILNIYFII